MKCTFCAVWLCNQTDVPFQAWQGQADSQHLGGGLEQSRCSTQMHCRCPKPGCGRCVALEQGSGCSMAAITHASTVLDVQWPCDEAFRLSCGCNVIPEYTRGALMCMSCRCPKPGCARCVALEEGFNSSRAAVLRAGRALDVRCSCGEAFCLCCGGAPHEPAPCAAVSWLHVQRD